MRIDPGLKKIVVVFLVLVTHQVASGAWAKGEPIGGEPLDSEPLDSGPLEEIVVRAEAPRFTLDTPLDPQFVYDADEVEAFAVDSLEELVEALAPNLSSGRGRQQGRPVILLNGQRIGSFREIRRFPPEAIERIEVYPEEVALRYGFRANQKVLNLVLRDPLSITTVRAEAGASTGGGAQRRELDGSHLRIADAKRLNVAMELGEDEALRESERQVIVTSALAPGAIDPRPYRTLLPEQNRGALTVSYARGLGAQGNFALAGDYQKRDSYDSLGPRLPLPSTLSLGELASLGRDQSREDLELNARLAGNWGGWRYSWLNRYGNARRYRETDRDGDFDRDEDRSRSRSFASELFVQTLIADLPQGAVQGNGTVRWERTEREAFAQSAGVARGNQLQRDLLQGAFSLDYPLFDGDRVGALALNANLEVADYSDVGTLTTIGVGTSWRGPGGLRINSSWTREEDAPSQEQLGEPLAKAPNRRLFDFETGSSANARVLSGGNPALSAEAREVLSLTLRFEPEAIEGLALNVNAVESTTDKPIQSFPSPSPEIQGAFPDRFLRDATGRLLEFDARPVNLDSATRREVRWGLDYRRSLRARGVSGRSERRLPGGRGSRNRLNLALFHTLRLRDELTLGPGLPAQDYLGISSGTRSDGGAEHEVTLRFRLYQQALSLRLDSQWQSATRSLPGFAERLTYADQTRINLSLAYRFSQASPWVKCLPFLNQTRVRLSIDNLFNDKPTVRDLEAQTPPGLSADELDPRGRAWELNVRKRLS